MNITSYMQALCTYVRSLTPKQDASGNNVYEFDEEAEGYVPRTIQIGLEAQSQYLFKRAVFQGMTGAAPVHVEMTYTMIKGQK